MCLTDEAQLALDCATIAIYLRDARPTDKDYRDDPTGTERRRVAAVRKLLSMRRNPQLTGESVRRALDRFFDEEWRRIVRNPKLDPVAEVGKLFLGHKRRGRVKLSDEIDLETAVRVQLHIDTGDTVEQACEKVAADGGRSMSRTSVRDIYYGPKGDEARRRWKRGIRAEIAMRILG
jgi:hypothetical protein